MYKEKQFHIRPLADVLEDFSLARVQYRRVERIFIADGDALIRKTDDWIEILNHIKTLFPECQRVTSYASPRSIQLKSPEDLKKLHQLGLTMVYLGLESGCDQILADMHKGETSEEIIQAGLKIKNAGIQLSVTAISGLGGTTMWQEHAIQTGKAFTRMKPDYIGLLTLMIVEGTPLADRYNAGEFSLLGPREVAEETLLMLSHMDCEGSVFRSNHASNYVSLKGTLNRDKEQMMNLLKEALAGNINFKKDWARGL
jgi:radical SAM superfamily enzyme YgiQ (UPF0313 family)